ncbi:MAG: AI-2E family transporter [Pseudonocardia sp.]
MATSDRRSDPGTGDADGARRARPGASDRPGHDQPDPRPGRRSARDVARAAARAAQRRAGAAMAPAPEPLLPDTAETPPTPPTPPPVDVTEHVPRALRLAAALGWRVLVVAAALYVLGVVVAYLAPVVVPVAIALLLAALLSPAVSWLEQRRVPRGPATALVMVGGLAALGGVLTFVVRTFVSGLPQVTSQLSVSVDTVVDWLTAGPLRLSPAQLGAARDQLLATLDANQAALTAGALTTAATIGQILTEFLLVLFTLIFFLHGGEQIWRFLIRAAPAPVRRRVDVAGRRAVTALVSYVRATTVVAVVDAVAIGMALGILGVPLAFSLAALVFLGAFVPIIGAVVAGAVAVLIAFVANGVVSALIVLAVVIAVMQLESHVLQPLLLGRAVKLHPLAVVLAIATGLLVGGIAGALLAVPLLAVVNSAVRSLRSPADEHVRPEDVHTLDPADTGPADPTLEREPTIDET